MQLCSWKYMRLCSVLEKVVAGQGTLKAEGLLPLADRPPYSRDCSRAAGQQGSRGHDQEISSERGVSPATFMCTCMLVTWLWLYVYGCIGFDKHF
jgi:hypothetical protein